MVTKKSWLYAILCSSMLFIGCKKDNQEVLSDSNNESITFSRVDCEPVVKQLADVNAFIDPVTGIAVSDLYGTLTITDLGTTLQVDIAAKPGFYLASVNVAYGTQAAVNATVANWIPCFGQGQYNNSYSYDATGNGATTATFTIPESMLDAAGCIWFGANVRFYDLQSAFRCTYAYPADQPNAQPWKGTFSFCRCIPPPEDCGPGRTQTPGGWGAVPHGNNPGTYLHANFTAAFPTGITLGGGGGFSATWTNAWAVTNYLPAGGQAAKLTANYVNPSTNQLKNVLVNHLLALTLSVRFDAVNPDFGAGGVPLSGMIIGSGAFNGWTVGAFLIEANRVLAGTSNLFTVQQVLTTASNINENYVDGNMDNGYLDCPNP